MKSIRHPHVVGIKEVFATSSKIFLVIELVEGGELFEYMNEVQMGEDEARYFFMQLVEGLLFCHNNNVCHRDLKPENLLLDISGNLKISDFGLSTMYVGSESEDQGRVQMLHTTCGTPNYVAPEILESKGYDGRKADVWSIGVILYVMIAGYLPFEEDTIPALFVKIKRARFTIPECFSPAAADLVSKILVANPNDRMALKDVRNHEWMQGPLVVPMIKSLTQSYTPSVEANEVESTSTTAKAGHSSATKMENVDGENDSPENVVNRSFRGKGTGNHSHRFLAGVSGGLRARIAQAGKDRDEEEAHQAQEQGQKRKYHGSDQKKEAQAQAQEQAHAQEQKRVLCNSPSVVRLPSATASPVHVSKISERPPENLPIPPSMVPFSVQMGPAKKSFNVEKEKHKASISSPVTSNLSQNRHREPSRHSSPPIMSSLILSKEERRASPSTYIHHPLQKSPSPLKPSSQEEPTFQTLVELRLGKCGSAEPSVKALMKHDVPTSEEGKEELGSPLRQPFPATAAPSLDPEPASASCSGRSVCAIA